MDSQKPWSNDRDSDDQLDPSLREVVERISVSQPPQDLVARSVKLAKRQVANQHTQPSDRRYRWATPWLVVLAVATSIVIAVTLWQRPDHDSDEPNIAVKSKGATAPEADEFDSDWVNESPTMWAYHQTAGQSSEQLDDLLTAHARDFRVSGPAMSVFGS